MKHSFIDKYSDLNSPIHRIDPRARLIAVFSAILIIVSEPSGNLFPFLFYWSVIIALVVVSGVPPGFIVKRCIVVSPIIIIAAAAYPLTAGHTGGETLLMSGSRVADGLTIMLKSFSSLVLLILLTTTGKFHSLLNGMRKLRMPKLLGIISALMYRYIFIIHDEMLRTTRARESRSSGSYGSSRFKVYGNQAAMIFIRSVDRSQTVYYSMVARGFQGEFPDFQKLSLRIRDVITASSFVLFMLIIRLSNQTIKELVLN